MADQPSLPEPGKGPRNAIVRRATRDLARSSDLAVRESDASEQAEPEVPRFARIKMWIYYPMVQKVRRLVGRKTQPIAPTPILITPPRVLPEPKKEVEFQFADDEDPDQDELPIDAIPDPNELEEMRRQGERQQDEDQGVEAEDQAEQARAARRALRSPPATRGSTFWQKVSLAVGGVAGLILLLYIFSLLGPTNDYDPTGGTRSRVGSRPEASHTQSIVAPPVGYSDPVQVPIGKDLVWQSETRSDLKVLLERDDGNWEEALFPGRGKPPYLGIAKAVRFQSTTGVEDTVTYASVPLYASKR